MQSHPGSERYGSVSVSGPLYGLAPVPAWCGLGRRVEPPEAAGDGDDLGALSLSTGRLLELLRAPAAPGSSAVDGGTGPIADRGATAGTRPDHGVVPRRSADHGG